jgi:hypothetical protein
MAVIEEGRAMWILGGVDAGKHYLSSTQIVRPGMPTERGPDMTEEAIGHCSTPLQDGSVIVTGGIRRSNLWGSPRTEIYNFTTRQWSQKKDMKQRRLAHSCTPVWLSRDNPDSDILFGVVSNTSILSIVVAGGKLTLSHYSCKSYRRTVRGWK